VDAELVTPPAALAVTVDELKAHCRVDSHDEDDYLLSLVDLATDFVQGHTGRQLITATWRLTLDGFAEGIDDDGEFRLPKAPLQSISSISYLDTAGDSQTWSSAEWQATHPAGPMAPRGRLAPAPGYSWPQTEAGRRGAVVVTFVAGYGAAATAVPARIKHALKLYAAEAYARREPIVVGRLVMPASQTVERLLGAYRCWR
jgi:uncharacterized phiE125 gp8 family phage protein